MIDIVSRDSILVIRTSTIVIRICGVDGIVVVVAALVIVRELTRVGWRLLFQIRVRLGHGVVGPPIATSLCFILGSGAVCRFLGFLRFTARVVPMKEE